MRKRWNARVVELRLRLRGQGFHHASSGMTQGNVRATPERSKHIMLTIFERIWKLPGSFKTSRDKPLFHNPHHSNRPQVESVLVRR